MYQKPNACLLGKNMILKSDWTGPAFFEKYKTVEVGCMTPREYRAYQKHIKDSHERRIKANQMKRDALESINETLRKQQEEEK